MNDETELTRAERLILRNQYSILGFLCRLKPALAKEMYIGPPRFQDWCREVLENGDQRLIDRLFLADQGPPRMTRDEQKSVEDILDMFRDLQRSVFQLPVEDGLTPQDVEFGGWDASSARGEFRYAQLLCDDRAGDRRFALLQPSPSLPCWDPSAWDRYQAMLAVWQGARHAARGHGFDSEALELMPERPLSAKEIRQILDAGAAVPSQSPPEYIHWPADEGWMPDDDGRPMRIPPEASEAPMDDAKGSADDA